MGWGQGAHLRAEPALGISQARILEWVAISFSGPRGSTRVSCTGRRIL